MQTFMRAVVSLMVTIAVADAAEQIRVTVDVPASSTPASSLALVAPPNAIVSGRLLLSNPSAERGVQHWEATASATACTAPQPMRWLEIEPRFGSVEAGHSTTIAIYASSFAASTGVRRGFLCIRSGTITEPLVEVPVALTVQDTPPAK